MKKILGNWTSEYAARFNANLGMAVFSGAVLLMWGSVVTKIFVVIFLVISLIEAIMSAREYYKILHDKQA